MQWPHAIVGVEPIIFNRDGRLRMLRANSLTNLVRLTGVRKNHNLTAAIALTDTILKNLDNSEIPIAIFLDLSMAFDTLDHAILFFF